MDKYPKKDLFYIGDIVLQNKFQGRLLLEITIDKNILNRETQIETIKIKFESNYTTKELNKIGFNYNGFMRNRSYWNKRIKLKEFNKEIKSLEKSGLIVNSNLDALLARLI